MMAGQRVKVGGSPCHFPPLYTSLCSMTNNLCPPTWGWVVGQGVKKIVGGHPDPAPPNRSIFFLLALQVQIRSNFWSILANFKIFGSNFLAWRFPQSQKSRQT